MYNNIEKLNLVDAQELLMQPMDRPSFIVDGIVPSGVNIIGGDEKSGKSWMMLQLAVSIATGQDFLEHAVHQGAVLYLSLEDTYSRLQHRLFELTDEVGFDRIMLGIQSGTLDNGLIEQLDQAMQDHPSLRLIIIDTLQLARGDGTEVTYSNDYSDVSKLVDFSRDHNVSIFIVHHLRKEGDSHNIFNRFNGTKGISAAVDTMFILDKENEYSDKATLCAKGRDMQQYEMTIQFRDCRWVMISMRTQEEIARSKAPDVLFDLIDFIKKRHSWRGSATELLAELGDTSVAANVITKYINQYSDTLLQEEGIKYEYDRNRTEGRLLSFELCDTCDSCDGSDG